MNYKNIYKKVLKILHCSIQVLHRQAPYFRYISYIIHIYRYISYIIHITYSLQTSFSFHVVLLISKIFNLNVYALIGVSFAKVSVVCHKILIILSNIIMQVGSQLCFQGSQLRTQYWIVHCRLVHKILRTIRNCWQVLLVQPDYAKVVLVK